MLVNPLRVVSAPRLARVRLVLHHAVQLLLPPGAPADSLRWALEERVLWGPNADGRKVGLRLGQVQLVTRDAESSATQWFRLGHQTLAAARGWLGGGEPRTPLLPHHAVVAGGRFPAASQASLQLEREFHGAAQLLSQFRPGDSGQITVSADTLAMSRLLAPRLGPLTVGFSPGSEAAEAPFWFVRRALDADPEIGPRDLGPIDPELAPSAVDAVSRFLNAVIVGDPLEGAGSA